MVFGFFKKRPDETASTTALSPAVRKTILSSLGASSIPAMPKASEKAYLLATNPSASARDFIDVIESDEALASRVLKIANSVYYDRGQGSRSVEESVTVIGTEELRSLLAATALREIFPSSHVIRRELWAHDIAVAIASRILAARLLPSKKDQSFLAGLMHDVGKLVMIQRHPDTFEKIMLLAERDGLSSCQAEESEYPFDHTEVGLCIAERWNFSEEIGQAIRRHHLPWEELLPTELGRLVKGADCIVHAHGIGAERALKSFVPRHKEQLPEVWEALHFPANEREAFLTTLTIEFERDYSLYA